MTNRLPERWTDFREASPFFDDLAQAPSALLMLDYDGTLAPFHEDRLKATLYDGVRERLEALQQLGRDRLVFISGRNARELHSLLSLQANVEIWGSHGREHLAGDGTYSIEALTGYEQHILNSVKKTLEAAYDPAMVECKPNSVAIHWRSAPSRENEMRADMEAAYRDATSTGSRDGVLQLLSFDGGLELRAGHGNKGDAVEKVLTGMPATTIAAFLGDDTTDEDAFAKLRSAHYAERSFPPRLAVLVRNEPRPSCAQAWIRPPQELLAFLDEWLCARKATP